MNVRAIDGGVGNEGGVAGDGGISSDDGIGNDDGKHYGGSASDPKELKPGDRVAGGAYEIEAVLGKGGMTTVYLANATASGVAQGGAAAGAAAGMKVALKIARGKNAARADVAARMRNEAAIGVGLEPHRNLVSTLGGGVLEDGSPFVATEFVRAPALADVLIMDRALPVARAVRMAIDVGRALLAMHARGFVHRDVKPGNILMLPEHAMLLDLGLATKAREPGETAPRMTAVFERPGTKHYMAPEQAAGAPADVRADVWSLGATLAEALVGAPPMGNLSEAECVAWKLDGSAPQYAMPRTRADVPDELAALVEAAVVREPRLRSSLGDFVEGLTRVLAGMSADGTTDGGIGAALGVGAATASGTRAGTVVPTVGSGSSAEGGRTRASMLMEIHRRAVTREMATGAGAAGSEGRGGAARWITVLGVVALVGVIGFGAWAWWQRRDGGRELAETSGGAVTQGADEVVPAAAVPLVPPPVEDAEPEPGPGPDVPMRPSGPVDEPVAKPAATPVAEVEVATAEVPRPTPAVTPKPAPTKPTPVKPTPTPSPAAAPEHESEGCKATRNSAAEAQRTRKHAEALRLLARRACWADRRQYTRMLVDSLTETQRFAACVKAARGSKDPEVVEMGQMCAELLGEEKP